MPSRHEIETVKPALDGAVHERYAPRRLQPNQLGKPHIAGEEMRGPSREALFERVAQLRVEGGKRGIVGEPDAVRRIGEEDAVRRFAAVVGIIGALAIPIGMIAVRLRRSIHPVVLARREGGSGLPDPWMRIGLVVSLVALGLLAVWLTQLRSRTARVGDDLETLRREGLDQRGEVA